MDCADKAKTIINGGVTKYTNKRDKHRNTVILHKLLNAEKKLSLITKDHATLQTRISAITELTGLKEVVTQSVDTDISKDVEPPTSNTDEVSNKRLRNQIIESLSIDEILFACRIKSREEYDMHKTTFQNIEHLCTFPQLLKDGNSYLNRTFDDDETSVRLRIKPYLEYYDMLLEHVIREEMGNKSKIEAARNIKVKDSRVLTVFTPSRWFQDFMQVFDCAFDINNIEYPAHYPMKNVYYEEKIVREIIDGKQSELTTIKLYSLDTIYHLVKFGSLFCTLYFQPILTESLTMQPACFTDFEILTHFAACMSEEINYKHFAQHPQSYLYGSNYSLLVDAIRKASEIVRLSYTKLRLVFFHTKTAEFDLGLFQYNDDGKRKPTAVPNNIMSVLRLYILDNMQMYKQRIISRRLASGCADTDCCDDVFSIQKHTAIGKLLNFDKRSAFEFERLSRRLCKADPSSVNLQIATSVGELSCVVAIYAMLVSASGALYALTKDESGIVHPEKVISRTMVEQPNTNDDVLYAGSTELFPGLLAYTMLGNFKDTHKLAQSYREAVNDVEQPYMTSNKYFENRKERVAFFDSFSSYSYNLPKLQELKKRNAHTDMRWMSVEKLQQIRVSAKQAIQTARASYIDILLTESVQNSEQFFNPEILNYFKTPLDKFLSTPLKLNVNLTNNFVFFMLPLLFSTKSKLVSVEKLVDKQQHGIPYAMNFFQLEKDMEDKQREKDMNETCLPSRVLDDSTRSNV